MKRSIVKCLLIGALFSSGLVQRIDAQCLDMSDLGSKSTFAIRCFDYHLVKKTNGDMEVFSWVDTDGAVTWSPDDHPRQTYISQMGKDDWCNELNTLYKEGTQSIRIATNEYKETDMALGAACANYIDITEDNCLIYVHYAAVMHNPGHEIASQPGFEDFAQPNIKFTVTNWKPDGKSQFVSCPYLYLYSNIEAKKDDWHKTKDAAGKDIIWHDWTTELFDFSSFIGERMIIQATVLDCSESDYDSKNKRITLCTDRHRARVYYTIECAPKQIVSEGACATADSMYLTAPDLYNGYRWYNKQTPEQTLSEQQTYAFVRDKTDATYVCELTDMCDNKTQIEQFVYAPRYVDVVPDELHFGETYEWHITVGGQDVLYNTYTHSIKDTMRVKHVGTECDSIIYCLDLHINGDPCELIEIEHIQDKVSLEGESEYLWERNGQTYYQSTKDTFVLKSQYACDSIYYYLDLQMSATGAFRFVEQEVCADSAHLLIESLNNEVPILTYSLSFDNKAQKAGFIDVPETVMPADNIIVIDMPVDAVLDTDNKSYTRPGKYSVTITETNSLGETHEHNLSFSILYPSAIIGQRWNDVLYILNDQYNGGYEISRVKWYKNNDIELPSRGTHGAYYSESYINGNYEEKEFNFIDTYYAKITRSGESEEVCTCRHTPKQQTGDMNDTEVVEITPALVGARRAINISANSNGVYRLYDISGRCLQSGDYTNAQHNTIVLPAAAKGTFILLLQPDNGKQVSKKLMID